MGLVVATASGFASGTAQPGDGSSDVVLFLGSEQPISGRVLLIDRTPPQQDITVFCWRDDIRYLAGGAFQLADGTHPLYQRVQAAKDGSFTFRGLEADTTYRLSAGGSGYAPHVDDKLELPQDYRHRAGDSNVEVFVAPLYAVDIVLRDESGGLLRTSRRLFQFPLMHIDPDSQLTGTNPGLPGVAVNGGIQPPPPGIDDSHRMYFVFTSTLDQDRIGPLRLLAGAPGYEPCEIGVYAERIRESRRSTEVRLRPLASGFGNLHVNFRFDDPSYGHAATSAPSGLVSFLGEVRLYKADAAPGTGYATFAYWRQDLNGIEVPGVPAGRYRAHVVHTLGVVPPIDVEIAPGSAASLDVPLAGFGGIEFFVRRRIGGIASEYTGPLQVNVFVRLGNGSHAGFFSFARAPYRVFTVPAGDVGVRVNYGKALNEIVPVRVDAGRITPVAMDIDVPARDRDR